MYWYKIGYGTYEESNYVELKHEKLFTKEDITKMIAEAIVDIEKSKPEKDRNWHQSSYQHFHKDVVQWLIENKGFVSVEYEVGWSVFGWASVFDINDWGTHGRGEEDQMLAKLLGEAGYGEEYSKMLNDKKEEEMNRCAEEYERRVTLEMDEEEEIKKKFNIKDE